MRLERRPAAGNMNQGYGPRPKPTPTSPAIHYGQDYGWGGGDAVYAVAPGRVKSYGRQPGFEAYGNRLVIDHGDGWETWYCHLSAAHVAPGDQVRAGQHVAEMGATGNVTAKHLHFELRRAGVATDPAPYFTATASTDMEPITLTLDYDADKGTIARIFQYDVREKDTGNGFAGWNIWDHFRRLGDAADRQGRRREEINARAEDRHQEVLSAIKANGGVTLSLTAESASIIADAVVDRLHDRLARPRE